MRSPVPALALATALLLRPTAVEAQFIDFGAVGQRAIIIAQQLTQIGHQITSITTLRQQFDELEDQLEHMRDEALGQVGELTSSFDQLSSAPADLLDSTVSWANAFTGDTRTLANAVLGMGSNSGSLVSHWQTALAAADSIGETEIRALLPADSSFAVRWRERRAVVERRQAGDYPVFEAAGRLSVLLDSAQASLNGLRAETNLSNTALQQLQLANQLTESEIAIARAQLMALTAVQDGLQRQERELQERRALQAWADELRAIRQQDSIFDAAIRNHAPSQFMRLPGGDD